MTGKPNTGLAKALRVASAVGLTLYSHRRPPGVTVPQRESEPEDSTTALELEKWPLPDFTDVLGLEEEL